MLCQFTVKNFQCIKDELTLDMQAANIHEHEQSLIIDADGERFLPLGVIYGPNGAGKSTVLRALYGLISKMIRPVCAATCNNKECLKNLENAAITPFRFSKETQNAPTEYELFFRTATYEYQYCVSILKEKVIREELYRKSIEGSRYSTIFTRYGTASITLKGSLKNYRCSDISDSLLLLSYFAITHRRNTIVKDIFNWIEKQFDFVDYSDPAEDARIPVTRSEEAKTLILKMMAEMDIDISDYRVEEKSDDIIEVFTTHKVDGRNYELNLFEESKGTIKVFSILPYVADSLRFGTTLFVDELDSKLHPLLLKYIISLFSDPEINKKGAQLVFTSHDLSTMNSDIFRRDEIWFVAKGENQATKMYSLVEFKSEGGKTERKDASYNKRYLEGRYGADPYLRRIIDWGDPYGQN